MRSRIAGAAYWLEGAASFRIEEIRRPVVVVLSPVVREPHIGPRVDSDGLASLDPASPNQRLAFVLRVEDDRVAFFEQGRPGHTILPLAEFETRYAGQVLQAAPKEKALADPDAGGLAREPFGFRWFVPSLLKHRRVFRDVLFASAAIQLMALATPLFPQGGHRR